MGKVTVGNSGSGSICDKTGIKGGWPNTKNAIFTHCDPTPCIADQLKKKGKRVKGKGKRGKGNGKREKGKGKNKWMERMKGGGDIKG